MALQLSRTIRLAALLFFPAILPAATGQIVFLGTEIDSGNIFGGLVGANMFDANFATVWGANTTTGGPWAGMDMGTAVTLTSYIITPRTDTVAGGCNGSCWNRGQGQSVLEATNDGTWSTGVVTLDTLAAYPYISQLQYNMRAVSPGTSYRYYRIRTPLGFGDVAELRFIGNAQSGVNAQPVMPTVAPFGGAYLSGSVSVTITSATTSAAIYYTTDGSAPSCAPAGTHYVGTFTLSIPAATLINLKAIACDATLSTQASEITNAYFRSYGWKASDTWYNTDDGHQTQPYAGNIVGPVSGKYYRTGQWMLTGSAGADGFADDPAETPGVFMYSSTDLLNWQSEGQILPSNGWTFIDRPHWAYNASTGNYVLWSNCLNTTNNSTYRACIATSTTPNGPLTGTNNWTWTAGAATGYAPGGHSFGDDYLFVDDDGTAYIVFENYPTGTMYIYQLASDWMSVTGSGEAIQNNGSRESPVLFKRNGVYFLITGPYTPYGNNAGTITYQTATSPLGTWSTQTALFSSDPYATAQASSIYLIPGRIDGYLFMLDNWGTPIYNSTPLALPLTFPTSTTVQAQTPTSWDPSYFAGTSSGAMRGAAIRGAATIR